MPKPQDGYVKTALRLPPDLHKAVHEAAFKAERSFNAEVIASLRVALVPQKDARPK